MALLPDLVPTEQLGHSNALFMISQNVMLLVGMAAGGLIVATRWASSPAFLVDGATFLISAAILAARPFRYLTVARPFRHRGRGDPAEKWHDIRQGVVWLWGRPSPALRGAVPGAW